MGAALTAYVPVSSCAAGDAAADGAPLSTSPANAPVTPMLVTALRRRVPRFVVADISHPSLPRADPRDEVRETRG
ncbi:hypothetical protein GCM10010252_22620 [Streptomyces aureoverticillatus]|nr:hypothetical protein GCM10010252_22620 [Streptomyces aureoverticillatus]